MPNATSPRKRGHAGRAAGARFVELEHILPVSGPRTASGLVLEIDGLRLILADRTAVAILAELFRVACPGGKGGTALRSYCTGCKVDRINRMPSRQTGWVPVLRFTAQVRRDRERR